LTWPITSALAGVVVAMGWLLVDFIVTSGAVRSPRDSLELSVAIDYARIFTWPSSLLGLYYSNSLAVFLLLFSVAINAVTYLALGWLIRFCSIRDKRLLVIPLV